MTCAVAVAAVAGAGVVAVAVAVKAAVVEFLDCPVWQVRVELNFPP